MRLFIEKYSKTDSYLHRTDEKAEQNINKPRSVYDFYAFK